ncbi:CPCC family cysteine-rich protein, partial [Clostridium sp. ZBS4]|uniref:CPCC family cysteine-rich protein n=1 Tax=Clostridium sp. ZBS4 TaxID=2949974 RepID=UPI00257CB1AB
LIEVLKHDFIGAKNEYLSEVVSKMLSKKVQVEGKKEILFACPCCLYQTIKERGRYEICPVCFWEDDGNNEINRYSSVNNMTLLKGK